MGDLLAGNPTLLLFVVAGLGFLLGRVRVGGFSLGVAAVLFAGIAIGALDPRLDLPEPVWVLGLVVFVYATGLTAGPGFLAALRRQGLPGNGLALVALGSAAMVVVALRTAGGVTPLRLVGAFAGALTNTPALAGVLDFLKDRLSGGAFQQLSADPVVGYSLTYPFGVLAPMVAAHFLLRGRARQDRAAGDGSVPLVSRTVQVNGPPEQTLGVLRHDHGVAFSRLKRNGSVQLATDDVVPQRGDLIAVVGTDRAVQAIVGLLGERSDEHLALDRRDFDSPRLFVTSHEVAGRRLGELDLASRFGATVTRVRRGDVDLLADETTVLELGDRVQVVAPRAEMEAVGRLFGDSYRALGEIDILTFSLGIAAGLLLGSVPIPVPGGDHFTLGFAGGPLIVGLLLGAVGRTGGLVWQLPHSANLTLRQLGTVLFLAGIGTRAGESFATNLTRTDALALFLGGAAVTVTVVGCTLLVGRRILRVPAPTLAGILAGIMTQPAVLAFATGRVIDETPVATGYATVYPVVMIAKIVLAQLIVSGWLTP